MADTDFISVNSKWKERKENQKGRASVISIMF